MKTKLALTKSAALVLLFSTLIFQPSTASAQGTVFTYQGSLNDNGSPANGANYGMVFYLYDAPTNGNLLGNLGIVSVSVSNGVFTVPLDFGTNFPGADRWLEITVQKNGGGFTTLSPRQKLSPTPYAITAANLSGSLPAVQLTGTIPAASIAGSYTSAVTLNNPANNFAGVFTGNGAGLTNIPTSGSAWQLTGNAGTTTGVNFLGTTDNQPLELKVNGGRALRLEPTANDANHSGILNVVGGSPVNFVAPGIYGATISGGGAVNYFGLNSTNSVLADFGTVGGGEQNTASGQYATVAGGYQNTASVLDATISGGFQNTANNSDTTVSGGFNNTASGGEATVGGGAVNTAGGPWATIAGGRENQAANNATTVAGGEQNSASGQGATVSGGLENTASGALATVSGGVANTNSGGLATIAGGYQNTIQINASYSAIVGGQYNTIQTNAQYCAIGGGIYNTISLAATASTIGGGGDNTIQFGAFDSIISGGGDNTIQTNASYSAIGGGANNTIQGSGNSFPGTFSTIGGGQANTIQSNVFFSTISGGSGNAAAGNFATIPGGDQNVAGTNSLAAGHRAKATNTGAFVWADSTDADFASTADNQFLIRAAGGVGIGANNPDATLTVNGTADKPGGGAWTVFSDARLKKNIEPLTGALNRLMELRAVTFEYKDPQSIHELPGVQIGMIAQEVEKVFPDWVDMAPNGMKRLSIHGFEALTVESLRELRAEKDAKISDLEKSNAEMQKQLAAQRELNNRMAARFDALEKTIARLADQSSVPLAVNLDAAK